VLVLRQAGITRKEWRSALVFLSKHDWHMNGIRGEPRFGQAMERARREWERLEV
jgi:hypothetical protein